jgi:two-component system, NarL family, nitrate/nitrite response regulator NarL
MRLVLCDDNRILCEALAIALEARGHRVLAIATTPDDGIASVAECKPDACLLDLRFPDGDDGIGAIGVIRRHYPATAVLVLSAITDPAAVSAAIEIGAAGFLGKDQDVDQIAAALDVIAAGGMVFEPVLPRKACPRPAGRPSGYRLCELTPREEEVLRRIAAGQSTGQMAREMQITICTLRTYVKNVLAKLGAHSRLQAAALASRGEAPGDDLFRSSA